MVSEKPNKSFHSILNFTQKNRKHFDSLAFSVATMMVMYAYVFRPETIPSSYMKLIQKVSPIEPTSMRAIKESVRGIPMDVSFYNEYARKMSRGVLTSPLKSELVDMLPCAIIHPNSTSCLYQQFYVYSKSLRFLIPLYTSISFFSLAFGGFKGFSSDPLTKIGSLILSSLRSSVFVASVGNIYNGFECIVRRTFSKDHKFLFCVGGFLSGLSILIEKKSKRAEFALYVIPRALDIFYRQLLDRKFVPDFPGGSILIFSFSIALLSLFSDHHPEFLPKFLKTLFDFLVPK